MVRLSRATVSTLVIWSAVIVALWGVYTAWPGSMMHVRSQLTGKRYKVRNVAGAKQVADRLASLELRLRKFLHDAESVAPGDHRLKNIRERWNGTLAEINDDSDVAYSMGKDAVSLCVRTGDGSLESENSAMYILLHELAHVATDSYGHKPEFWSNMRFLLEIAEATGAYTYQDFDSTAVSYCGRPLSGSPLTCVKKGECASELKKRPERNG